MVYKPLLQIDIEYYRKIFDVNFHGCFHVTRALAPLMVESGGGSIVNQSSTAAYAMTTNGPYYGISKLAINGLTMAFAAELGPRKIRVNGIAPGPTMTEALRGVSEVALKRIVEQMPLARLGTTDEMADAVLFLLSDAASFITGQTICVDGGMVRKP
jgi:3-oxoacyl-[acyl-carrier protein] reductase